MDVKKILILGIDAVEYELVEKWNLQNLKQEECGKTKLPIYPGEEPNTRIVWPCFITGKMPHQMGYVTSKVFKQPLQFFLNILLPKVKFLFNPQRDNPSDVLKRKAGRQAQLTNKLYYLLNTLNLTRVPEKSDIKAATFFDAIPDSIHAHIPIYDEYLPPYARRTIEAIEDKAYQPIFEMQCKQEFNQRSKEVLEWIDTEKKWRLGMQYFWCLDGIQHAFFNNEKKIARFYIMFDEFIEKVRKNINDDTLLLIVSDHGQKNGIHTNHGFYSSNKALHFMNQNLIDFKETIERLLKNGKR